MASFRFTSMNPLVGLLGCLLFLILLPLLPIIVLIFIVLIIFGRSFSIRKQYERFRDSRFYEARRNESKPADPDVCDVECTVISSEPVDEDKK